GAGVCEILVAKLRQREGVPPGLLCRRRVTAGRDLAQEPPGLDTRGIGSPRAAVAAYGEPALAPLPSAVEQDVADGFALLAPCAKACDNGVPDGFARLELRNLAMTDTLARPHVPSLSCLPASNWLAGSGKP